MKKVRDYKFTILCACLILVALLLPSSTFRKVPSFFGLDKIAHLVLFFLFALAYMLEYEKVHGRFPQIFLTLALVLSFVIGSEMLQLLTPSRHFELLDMAFDTLGAGIAFAVSRIVRKQGKR
ncbi:MAG: VanZ family protein [Spirochaetaceae bacterium]|nr:VanZ family protein [Spirochaetaceae bacterium]